MGNAAQRAIADELSNYDFNNPAGRAQFAARMKNPFSAFLLAGSFLFGLAATAAETSAVLPRTNSFPVAIRVDAARPKGELHPIWRFFGYDEPNYTYMKDGKKLLSELGQLAS